MSYTTIHSLSQYHTVPLTHPQKCSFIHYFNALIHSLSQSVCKIIKFEEAHELD